MWINNVFDKIVFSNSAVKLLLNLNPIIKIINNFEKRSFRNWEERECPVCDKFGKCKKHRAIERITKTDAAVKITGMCSDELDGVYVAKSDIFVFNHKSKSLLVFDCPPLYSPPPVNDVWIRKMSPFSVGCFDDNFDFKINQTIDINEILQNKMFISYFGRLDGDKLNIGLHWNYSSYAWEIKQDKGKSGG